MKFGKYYEKQIIHEWRFFYIDYKKLKNSIKYDNNSLVFYEIINTELRKL